MMLGIVERCWVGDESEVELSHQLAWRISVEKCSSAEGRLNEPWNLSIIDVIAWALYALNRQLVIYLYHSRSCSLSLSLSLSFSHFFLFSLSLSLSYFLYLSFFIFVYVSLWASVCYRAK